MSISEICSRAAVTISADQDLVMAAQLMRSCHVGFLVVTAEGSDGGEAVGVLTDRDIVIEVVSKNVNPLQLYVRDAMSRKPLLVRVDSRPEEALAQMRAFGVRRAPVVDADGRLAGVLSLDDLLDWLASALSDAAGLVRHEQHIERKLRA